MFSSTAYEALHQYIGLALHSRSIEIITSQGFFLALILIIFGGFFLLTGGGSPNCLSCGQKESICLVHPLQLATRARSPSISDRYPAEEKKAKTNATKSP